MNETRIPDGRDDEAPMQPEDAAALLKQAGDEARRQFDLYPPVLALVRAIVVLAAYGSLWLSVIGQHPYKGPTVPGILGMIAAVVVFGVTASAVYGKAAAGISGRLLRQRRALIAAGVVGYIAVSVVQGALLHHGLGNSIVFGVFPAVGPLIVLGPLIAGFSGVQEDWLLFGVGIALALVGAGAAFAGPVAVWGICAVGAAAVFLTQAAVQFWVARG